MMLFLLPSHKSFLPSFYLSKETVKTYLFLLLIVVMSSCNDDEVIDSAIGVRFWRKDYCRIFLYSSY